MSLGEEAELERELDRLYGLPLGEFIGARNELAKRASGERQRAIAARIKELRKPTVSAWVVNQLARERELDVQRLLKAGERLAVAQREAVAGRAPDAFRDARAEEQRALTQLAAGAREILEREGHGAGTVERVTRTLRAAAVSEEGRDLLKRGRMTEDLEPHGFEALAGIPAPAVPKGRKKDGRDRAAERRTIEEARRTVRELKKRAAARASEAAAADGEAAQAERRAAELREEAEQAAAEARAAADAVAEAEDELEALTKKISVDE